MRCLDGLMGGGWSELVQAARQIYLPFNGKVYLTTRLDRMYVMTRTTGENYEGLVARPVEGLWIFGFYDVHCHPVITLDVVNSLVDYVDFSVFNCLPEYEDGFEEQITAVLDGDGGQAGKKTRKSRHEKEAFTSQKIFALPVDWLKVFW